MATSLVAWERQLAHALVGQESSSQVARQATAILIQGLPGVSAVLWELDRDCRHARGIAVAPASLGDDKPMWVALPARLRDAALSHRVIRIPDAEQVTELRQMAEGLPWPTGAVGEIWPLINEQGFGGLLLTGHGAGVATDDLELRLPRWEGLVQRGWIAATRIERLERAQARRDRELEMAVSIQRSLIPRPFYTDDWTVLVYHATDQALAGDFALVEELEGRLNIAIADVSGRGIPASLTMMAAYSLLQGQLVRGGPLEEIMAHWSAELHRLSERSHERSGEVTYTTAVVLAIDSNSGAVEFAKAGHPHPLRYDAEAAEVEAWDANGYPAGLFADQSYEVQDHSLAAGDSLVLYTDGFSEANRGSGQLGVERIKGLLERFGAFPAPVIEDQLRLLLEGHLLGQVVGDDTTLLVLSRSPGRWQERSGVPTSRIAETFATGFPGVEERRRESVLEDLQAAVQHLQDGLPLCVAEAPAAGWNMKWINGSRAWHGAVEIPGISALGAMNMRPSSWLATLSAVNHPLCGFARRVDFCWNEGDWLRFVRSYGEP
ncbi:MAG: PP2C family protein-serine/threonine phosphatase [bacterium]